MPEEFIEWSDAWLELILEGTVPCKEGGREGGRK